MSDYQQQIDALQNEIDVIEQLQDDVKTTDSIGETCLSGLFHEARTASDHWSKATAFCRIDGGDVVVESVNKLSEGRWQPEVRKAYDVVINVSTRPFMDTDEFRRRIEAELEQAVRGRVETVRNLKMQEQYEQRRA